VARHVVGLGAAREMARALAYDLPRATYKLDTPTPSVSDVSPLMENA
jgi:hypothetical protein